MKRYILRKYQVSLSGTPATCGSTLRSAPLMNATRSTQTHRRRHSVLDKTNRRRRRKRVSLGSACLSHRVNHQEASTDGSCLSTKFHPHCTASKVCSAVQLTAKPDRQPEKRTTSRPGDSNPYRPDPLILKLHFSVES